MNMREFRINVFITIKLVRGKSVIYIKNKRFRQCRFLLIINPHLREAQRQIDSIDEASEFLSSNLEKEIIPKDLGLTPEQVFWGHCSNIQVWAEHDYDTRIIHSNLAFPFLKKLTEAGDPLAKKVFKDEIAKRFLSGYIPVAIYLMNEGYLEYLNEEEFQMVIQEFSNNVEFWDVNYKKKDLANAWNNLSLVLCNKGQFNKAIKASKQAIKLKEFYTKAWNNLGYIYNEAGEYDKAINTLVKALELDPNYFLAWNNLALSYIEKGFYEHAKIASKIALDLVPDYANALCHLGYAYYKTGNKDVGIILIRKGLSIKPNYKRGWNYLDIVNSKQ